jgi:hypothetical protein
MNKLVKYILIVWGLLIAGQTFGQIASVSMSINKDTIFVGDTLNLTLKVHNNLPGKLKINFPFFKDTITSNIHVLVQDSVPDTLNSNKKLILSSKYVISSYDSGNVIIPPLPIILHIDTITDTIFTSPASFFVKLYPTDTLKVPLKDVKKPINTPLTLKEFLDTYGMYLLIGLLLIIIVYVLIRYFSRRKQGKSFIDIKKPQEPAHIVAIRKLNALREKKLWQKDLIKEYYSELTDILREYLDNRFGMNTMESTSSEIIESLKPIKEIDDAIIKDMEQLFGIADLAKFAKYKPLPDENDFALKKAFEFVEKTKPVERSETTEENKEESNNNAKKVEDNASND